VSALSDAFATLKNVILMQDKLERMQKEIESNAADLRGLRDYSIEIDRRVTRIEGIMEGYQRASTTSRPPRLPRR
jgi:hypothetical protein